MKETPRWLELQSNRFWPQTLVRILLNAKEISIAYFASPFKNKFTNEEIKKKIERKQK